MTEAIEFFTTRLLRYLEQNGPSNSEALAAGLHRETRSIHHTIKKLRQQGCVAISDDSSPRAKLYQFLRYPVAGPSPIPRMKILKLKPRIKSNSGTGIITPPRQPQPFKPLVRRDFLERMELAEMTR